MKFIVVPCCFNEGKSKPVAFTATLITHTFDKNPTKAEREQCA